VPLSVVDGTSISERSAPCWLSAWTFRSSWRGKLIVDCGTIRRFAAGMLICP